MKSTDPFSPSSGADDDEIPVIDDAMLHSSVDFEAGMSAFPPVSLTLMFACALVFAFQVWRGALTDLNVLSQMGALVPDLVRRGEAWRLVSATFMHGSYDHLLGNLMILFILGMACEHGFGGRQFLFLYVASGIAGSICSLGAGKVSVGASGAIFGLAGALIVLFVRHRNRLHVRDRRIGVVLAVWAAYQIVLGLLSPNIDNHAHLGGLLGGIGMGLILEPAVLDGRDRVAARPRSLAGLALACVMLLTTAVYFIPRLVH